MSRVVKADGGLKRCQAGTWRSRGLVDFLRWLEGWLVRQPFDWAQG